MYDKQSNKQIRDAEAKLLQELRALRRAQRGSGAVSSAPQLSAGQHVADKVAATMGSWRFIIIQSVILCVWIVLNVLAFVQHWDPYPFILLNLALSFQAAYAAPFIMMSQNRQADIDRQEAANDYKINIKAELEIELLHDKITAMHSILDVLREREVVNLTQTVSALGGGNLRLELFVADLAASRAFYEDVLDFSVSGTPHDGYIALTREGVAISLNRRSDLPAGHPLAVGAGDTVGRGVEIVIEVDDVAKAHAHAVRGAAVTPLQAQSWGLTDFRVTDPDGYYLRVTSRPG